MSRFDREGPFGPPGGVSDLARACELLPGIAIPLAVVGEVGVGEYAIVREVKYAETRRDYEYELMDKSPRIFSLCKTVRISAQPAMKRWLSYVYINMISRISRSHLRGN